MIKGKLIRRTISVINKEKPAILICEILKALPNDKTPKRKQKNMTIFKSIVILKQFFIKIRNQIK